MKDTNQIELESLKFSNRIKTFQDGIYLLFLSQYLHHILSNLSKRRRCTGDKYKFLNLIKGEVSMKEINNHSSASNSEMIQNQSLGIIYLNDQNFDQTNFCLPTINHDLTTQFFDVIHPILSKNKQFEAQDHLFDYPFSDEISIQIQLSSPFFYYDIIFNQQKPKLNNRNKISIPLFTLLISNNTMNFPMKFEIALQQQINHTNNLLLPLQSTAIQLSNSSRQPTINTKRQAYWKDAILSEELQRSRKSSESQKTTLYHDYLEYQERFGSKKRASYRIIIDSKNYLNQKKLSVESFLSHNSSNTQRLFQEIDLTEARLADSYVQPDINQKGNNSKVNEICLNSQKKIKQSKIVKKEDFHDLSNENLQISSELLEMLQIKLSLYLQSEYKTLKCGSFAKQQASLNQKVFETLLNLDNKSDNHLDEESNDSNHMKKNNIKSHNFNMSKYFMFFLIRLFDSENLSLLGINDSVRSEIISFIQAMEKLSQKNELSKTHYFNHNHFDLLFLQLNDQTFLKLSSNPRLRMIHQRLFQFGDLQSKEAWESINQFKSKITQIALSQLESLSPFISYTKFNESDLSEIQKRDFSSKLQYFQRVKRAILQLQSGKSVYRF